jgi:cytochrome c biogenesis factor
MHPVIIVGELSLWLALLMGTWAVTASFADGWLHRDDLITSGERSLLVAGGFVALAALGLWSALAAGDLSLRYVASFTSSDLPTVYRLAAFWAGRAGALLLWAFALAFWAGLATLAHRADDRQRRPWVTGTYAAILSLAVAATALSAHPFARLDWIPLEGRGLDPQLQHPAMLFHAPTLALGFAATVIPLGLTVGALATRRLDAAWLGAVRRWTLVSWGLLTLGILIGLWWAYVRSGEDGAWVRHAAGSASLPAWLAASALLHAIAIEERRGAFRSWTVALVVTTFALGVVGAVVASAGVIPSPAGLSRDAGVPWSVWPLSVGALLIAVTGGASLLTRRRAPGESAPRRLGRGFAHAGIALLLAALAGTPFARYHGVTLADGQSFTVEDPFGREWTFTSDGISRFGPPTRDVVVVAVIPQEAGRARPLLTSERREFYDLRGDPSHLPSTEAGILTTLRQDVRLELLGTRGDVAALRIGFHPLVVWVWIGGVVSALGGLIVMWPAGRGAPSAVTPALETGYVERMAEELIARARARVPECPECGPRPEPDALHCSDCGRALG